MLTVTASGRPGLECAFAVLVLHNTCCVVSQAVSCKPRAI